MNILKHKSRTKVACTCYGDFCTTQYQRFIKTTVKFNCMQFFMLSGFNAFLWHFYKINNMFCQWHFFCIMWSNDSFLNHIINNMKKCHKNAPKMQHSFTCVFISRKNKQTIEVNGRKMPQTTWKIVTPTACCICERKPLMKKLRKKTAKPKAFFSKKTTLAKMPQKYVIF